MSIRRDISAGPHFPRWWVRCADCGREHGPYTSRADAVRSPVCWSCQRVTRARVYRLKRKQ